MENDEKRGDWFCPFTFLLALTKQTYHHILLFWFLFWYRIDFPIFVRCVFSSSWPNVWRRRRNKKKPIEFEMNLKGSEKPSLLCVLCLCARMFSYGRTVDYKIQNWNHVVCVSLRINEGKKITNTHNNIPTKTMNVNSFVVWNALKAFLPNVTCHTLWFMNNEYAQNMKYIARKCSWHHFVFTALPYVWVAFTLPLRSETGQTKGHNNTSQF